MRILSLTVGLALLAGTVHAQPAQLYSVTVDKETELGSLKVVEGNIAGPVEGTANPPHACTVWVNGISGRIDLKGHYRVLIPNEKLADVYVHQPGFNVVCHWQGRDQKRQSNFAKANEPEIRDLLNHPKATNDVASGGGDGGIRDLLNQPQGPSDVASGGGDGGIRDLLNKPPVTSGGGDGGIRDLLQKPEQH